MDLSVAMNINTVKLLLTFTHFFGFAGIYILTTVLASLTL